MMVTLLDIGEGNHVWQKVYLAGNNNCKFPSK